MSKKTKKRFIAGAKCPQCGAMDTLMLYFENNVEKLECVSCGYQEVQTDKKVAEQQRQNESVIGVFKP